MAPSRLLKHVFRNVLHRRSKENMHTADNVQTPRLSISLPNLRDRNIRDYSKSEQRDRPPVREIEDTALATVEEGDEVDNMSAAEVRREMEKYDPPSTSTTDSLHTEQKRRFDSLISGAKFMAISHLDTIDTALVLLQALENFSAHVEQIEKEMLEKRLWCEEYMEKLQRLKSSREVDEQCEIEMFSSENGSSSPSMG